MAKVQEKNESNLKSFTAKPVSGVYLITCFGGGKNRYYIGESNNLNKRLNWHKNKLIKGIHHNYFLQNCFEKYGIECFNIKILEYCKTVDLLRREAHYINLYGGIDNNDVVFNNRINETGNKRIYSECSKIKMSNSAKKFVDNNPNYLIDKGAKLKKTFKNNPDILRNRSIRSMDGKRIVQLNKNGDYINTYDCLLDIKDISVKDRTRIIPICNGKGLSAYGYKWQWEKDFLNKVELPTKKPSRDVSVVQFSLEGLVKGVFSSLTEASIETDTKRTSISGVLNGTYRTANNFLWQRLSDYNNNKELKLKPHRKAKAVMQIDLQTGKDIISFDSVTIASKQTGVNYSSIIACSRGKAKTAGGYNWKYI